MQIVVEREALGKALARAVGVIEARATIPILKNVVLHALGPRLEIRATDTDMEVTTACQADTTKAVVTTVDGRVLADLVKKCPEGSQIGLTLDPDAARLKVVAGRSRFTLPVLPAEDFPTLSEAKRNAKKGWREFVLPAGELHDLLGSVRFAIATDETRYYLNGVYLHQDGEHLAAVATDGHRLALRRLALPAGADGVTAVILPRKLVTELLRHLGSDGEVSLEISPERVTVTTGELKIVSKLIDGTFPDYKRVIPSNAHQLVADREAMLRALERVSVVLSAKANGVNLKIGGGEVELQAQSPELGVAFDTVEAAVDGPGQLVGVNSRYFADILGACQGASVAIHYGDPSAAMLIHGDAGADGFTMVLMPMRASEIRVMKEAA